MRFESVVAPAGWQLGVKARRAVQTLARRLIIQRRALGISLIVGLAKKLGVASLGAEV